MKTGYALPVKTCQKLLLTLRMSSKALIVTYTAHPDPGLLASLVSSPWSLLFLTTFGADKLPFGS